jgi:uridylate kinase
MQKKLPYKRVLLKLSGEILACGMPKALISYDACQSVARGIRTLYAQGVKLAIVIGGGNIFRGIQAEGLEISRTPADHMGMLATLINGVALREALERQGYKARILSAIECPRICESFNWKTMGHYFDMDEILIFVGGTGNPYFTTDTAAALRACEMDAEVLLKATKVDGVYDKDPKKYPNAKRYKKLTYTKYLEEKLEVMDGSAVALCERNQIPILVFDMELLLQAKTIDLQTIQKKGTLISGS